MRDGRPPDTARQLPAQSQVRRPGSQSRPPPNLTAPALYRVTDPGQEGPEYDARYLMNEMAEGTWFCGDPGVQYESTINRWHTCKNTGPINASNPCSEYMFLDDTACNLASINLRKCQNEDGSFDVERFRRAAAIFITAQEILVDHASYPTPAIAENSHLFRPLGLGFGSRFGARRGGAKRGAAQGAGPQ